MIIQYQSRKKHHHVYLLPPHTDLDACADLCNNIEICLICTDKRSVGGWETGSTSLSKISLTQNVSILGYSVRLFPKIIINNLIGVPFPIMRIANGFALPLLPRSHLVRVVAQVRQYISRVQSLSLSPTSHPKY